MRNFPAFVVLLACSTSAAAQAYQQVNLVSDFNAGLAQTQDTHLVNPWGLISSSTSPFWVADNNGGVSTLYNGNTGAIVPLVVKIPPVVPDPNTPGQTIGTGTPTGEVALISSTGFGVASFLLTNGTVAGTTGDLPGGSYTVTAHYPGDATFSASDSTPRATSLSGGVMPS